MNISVRPASESDYQHIVNYFHGGDASFYQGMGVDPAKLPEKNYWLDLLADNHQRPLEKKEFYYIIWVVEGQAIGHSNINKIKFGEEAYMHLHMWKHENRSRGLGLELVKSSIPFYFENFSLERLWCEPYALNPAPNKTLKRIGFTFVKEYETIPGWISFHQPVNRWCLTQEQFISSPLFRRR